jgi:hypothetical protein
MQILKSDKKTTHRLLQELYKYEEVGMTTIIS